MSERYDKREKGMMVELLDTKELERLARNVLSAQYGDSIKTDKYVLALDMAIGMAFDDKAARNSVFVVNEEGVGEFRDHIDLLPIWMIGRGEIIMFEVKASRSLIDLCRTSEYVDLADFIRVFGDRLDTNHSIWFKAMKMALPKEKSSD